jgi:beta-lactamase class A
MFTLLLAAALTLPPQKSDAILGVTAIHVESGKRISVRGGERFPMGSVYKFPIALTVLHQVDQGKLSLDQKIRVETKHFSPGWSPLRDKANGQPFTATIGELVEAMTVMSDNTASDVLLNIVGGPAVVTKRMQDLGVSGVSIDRSEMEMSIDLGKDGGKAKYAVDPRDTSTPDGMVDLLLKLWNRKDGLSAKSHDLLFKHMAASPTGPRKLRATVPKGWTVAHKTGSMPGTSNDAGILISPDGKTHVAIAIFTKARTSAEAIADADIANAVRAILRNFGVVPAE